MTDIRGNVRDQFDRQQHRRLSRRAATGLHAGLDHLRHLSAKAVRRGRHRAVSCHPDPDAGSGDLHHHRHRDGNCRRQDRAVRRQARRVRGHPDRDFLRGLCRAAVRGGHRAGCAGLVHRTDPDLGRDVIGAARAAADIAGQIRRAAGDPVSVGAGDARLRAGGRGLALSRRGAAQSRSAAALRDLGRGAAGYDAALVEGRARSGAGSAGRETTGARKIARPGADVLHRLDGHPVARLSTAFLHQQHAVLPALRQAGRIAMADAGVLDRLQHRDVSGERRGQAPRRADRDGRRRPARGAGGARLRKRPAISTC